MKKLFAPVLASVAAIVATVGFSIPQASAATGPYYLALGDSLSVGWQPNANGIGLATDQGYVDDIYASELTTNPALQLVKMGCPGETTVSFIKGGVCATTYLSQLTGAEKFLRKFGSQTSFVTLDIGANNVDNCVSGQTVDLTCISTGITKITKQIPKILAGLKAADPTVQIFGMTYYDPFLAEYLTGTTGQTLAQESISLTNSVNAAITTAYQNAGVPVADVANDSSFATSDFTFNNGDTIGGNPVPDDVFNICELTYMCAAAPVGPNIHANPTGYQAIANDFLALNP